MMMSFSQIILKAYFKKQAGRDSALGPVA